MVRTKMNRRINHDERKPCLFELLIEMMKTKWYKLLEFTEFLIIVYISAEVNLV